MKTSIWLAAILGTATALSAQTADQTQTRSQKRVQAKDQTQAGTQTQSRLQKRDGSCGLTLGPGAGQRTGQTSANRGGRGR